MIKSVKLSKLLDGYRGAPPADVPAVQDLLLRVSAMVEDNPEITEMDLNPVAVMPAGQGCYVLDARISVR
jgi:acyl-CoA synthetase (NDP forming)